MTSVIYTVLRTSLDFNLRHVERLRNQTDIPIVTISDTPILNRVPLKYEWPGWWSKLELMRPEIAGPLFYLDLDTTILNRDLRPFLAVGKTTLLSDFYRPSHLQSAVMYLTAEDRARVWEAWQRETPEKVMARFKPRKMGWNGDQNFIEEVLGVGVQRWQDVMPGRVASYKVDIRDRADAGEPRIEKPDLVVYHGAPRPWQAELPKWI